MRNTDQRIADGKPVTPGFLLAVLLWQDYQARRAELETVHKPAEARAIAASTTLAEEQVIIAIPRRFSQFVRDVWMLQPQLEARRPRAIHQVHGHERFRAAYDFLVLRAEAGDDVAEQAEWWTGFQEQDPAGKQALIDGLREPPAAAAKTAKRRRRRRRRKPAED